MEKLSPTSERFVLHWGELGTRCGLNRTVAQIHALLYISPQPLPGGALRQLLRFKGQLRRLFSTAS
ncbi:hypothetical protein [Paludibaculum fermentans]|uniref:hypothetical protein n=1 Tax=Paludibaculum fermentans TaxID=1473598 RepID=UPI003EB801FF